LAAYRRPPFTWALPTLRNANDRRTYGMGSDLTPQLRWVRDEDWCRRHDRVRIERRVDGSAGARARLAHVHERLRRCRQARVRDRSRLRLVGSYFRGHLVLMTRPIVAEAPDRPAPGKGEAPWRTSHTALPTSSRSSRRQQRDPNSTAEGTAPRGRRLEKSPDLNHPECEKVTHFPLSVAELGDPRGYFSRCAGWNGPNPKKPSQGRVRSPRPVSYA
jgi:hypothetical protein